MEQPKKRVCKVCNEIFDLIGNFSKNRNINEERETYRHTCKTCEKVLKKEKNCQQYLKNKERLKEQYRLNKQLKEINKSDYIV